MKIENLRDRISEKVCDPRRRWGNLRHKLCDILVIGFCTIICGGEDFTDMQDFGNERIEWLKTYLELPNGIPDSDTFRRVFERVNPKELSDVLLDWVNMERSKRGVIAVDGKTICGSGNNHHKAYHVVSAFAAETEICLGELCVAEKTNEITAVPELLDLIDIENAIITTDAMSCQKKITEKITVKKADYVIGLKENQGNLYEDVKLYFDTQKAKLSYCTPIEKDHGRIEKREYFLETDIKWLFNFEEWTNLSGIGMVKSKVTEKGQTRTDTRYFITSLTNIEEFSYAVRKHWSIENQLHWCLDVIFREDDSRARKDNSPLNLNVMYKTALTVLKQIKYGRIGNKKKMFMAALNPARLEEILFGKK